jgi:Putative polyhydroxyalkanoic acid system protein (PHA_gran_rgn)
VGEAPALRRQRLRGLLRLPVALRRRKISLAMPRALSARLENLEMPNLTVTVSHSLSQDEALRRIQAMAGQFAAQFSGKAEVQQSWNGYVGTFQVSGGGRSAPTTVTVNPSDVTMQVELPFVALAFKSTIESRARDLLTRALA